MVIHITTVNVIVHSSGANHNKPACLLSTHPTNFSHSPGVT